MITGNNKAMRSPESGGDQASMADQGADKLCTDYQVVALQSCDCHVNSRHGNLFCSWVSFPSFASRGSRKEEK